MKNTRIVFFFGILAIIALAAMAVFLPKKLQVEEIRTIATSSEIIITKGDMKISSQVFQHNGSVPSKYTCDADNVSPPLSISEVPEGAKSLALIVDDPDAPVGDWVHWLVWNIPVGTAEIGEATAPEGIEGTTDFGEPGWGGPCPPSGTHRYFFKLYALDTELDLPATGKKKDLEEAMKDHILDEVELIGTYKRM